MRLIDAEQMKRIVHDYMYRTGSTMFSREQIFDFLYDCDCIEAAPVVHGRWILNVNIGYDCSRCGRNNPGFNCKSHYCPNCGAKMDGEKDG